MRKPNTLATKIVTQLMCPQIRADAERLARAEQPEALRDLLAVNHPPALVDRLVPFFVADAEQWRQQCRQGLAGWPRTPIEAQPLTVYHVSGRTAAQGIDGRLSGLVKDSHSQDPEVREAARQTLARLMKGRRDG